VDPNKLRFVEESTVVSSVKYQLQSSTVDTTGVQNDAADFVTIIISLSDIDEIFFLAPHIGITSTNSELSIRPGFARDIGSNQKEVLEVEDKYAGDAARVAVFQPDIIKPLLISFDLFIGNRTVDLYFNEVVNCPLTDITALYFQVMQNLGFINTEKMQLTPASSKLVCTRSYQKMVRITVGLDDMVNLKVCRLVVAVAACYSHVTALH
jgi:hypothetical protein